MLHDRVHLLKHKVLFTVNCLKTCILCGSMQPLISYVMAIKLQFITPAINQAYPQVVYAR